MNKNSNRTGSGSELHGNLIRIRQKYPDPELLKILNQVFFETEEKNYLRAEKKLVRVKETD